MTQILTPWRGVAAGFAVNGLLGGTWASRIPAIAQNYGFDKADLGVVLLCAGAGAVASFAIAGRLADRYGASLATRWIGIAYLVWMMVLSLSPTSLTLGISLFIFGMLQGSIDVTVNSWATEVQRKAGKPLMASFHAMWSLGAATGGALGFAATSFHLSVPVHFLLIAIFGLIVISPFLWVKWDSLRIIPGVTGAKKKAPVISLPRGPLVFVGFMFLAAGVGGSVATDWGAVYLHDTVGVVQSKATLGFMVFSLIMLATRIIIDRLVAILGPVQVTRLSGMAAAAGLVLVIFVGTLPACIAGFALMGMGYAAIAPLAFSRAASDPEIPAGQGIASVATLGYGAMLMGPPLIGFIAQATSLTTAFIMVGTLTLGIIILAPVMTVRRARTMLAG